MALAAPTLSNFYRFISPSFRRKGVFIILLVAIGSILDFFSLASFLPMLMLIVKPEFISENQPINELYHFLGFPSREAFIISFAGVVLLFTILKSIVGMRIARVKARYAFTAGNEISMALLNKYLQTDFIKFLQLDYSFELNRLSGHPIAFANNIILPVTTIFSETLVASLIVAGVAYFDYRVLFLFCCIMMPLLFLFRIKRKTLKAIDQSFKYHYPVLLKYSYQIVEGFPEIRSYVKEKYFAQKFKEANHRVIETLIKDQTLQSGTTRFTEIIAGVIICSLVAYAILAGLPYQEILLLLGLYAGATFRIIPSVGRIMISLQQIRSHQYLLEELDVSVQSKAVQPVTIKPMSFEEKVELKNISFQFPDGPPLLKDIFLTIRKGEMVALTGKSGAGKTTLLLILLRFLKETKGSILVDNQPLTNDQSWLGKIGYVPQRPYILDGSVLENVAFGVPADQVDKERVRDLIRLVELNDWITELPLGINARLGEQGSKLSGGQRQRIAIARALYADVEFFLLDEITNQLDAYTEQEILTTLSRVAFHDKTILMITHRAELLQRFDRVLNLENGILQENSRINSSLL